MLSSSDDEGRSNQTENELQGGAFIATAEELLAVDTAIAAIDAGEIATDAEVKAAFAKFPLA